MGCPQRSLKQHDCLMKLYLSSRHVAAWMLDAHLMRFDNSAQNVNPRAANERLSGWFQKFAGS
jgi:hypothetical protein